MTEEIIIDGVNVAGCHNKTPYKNDYGDVQCKCYRFEDIENNAFLFGICKQHPNCYYKQLKRLEFELKVTKADYEASEQENKELKEKLEKIYRLSDIAYDKILNLTEVSYGLNEIIDIQKIIKDDKTIYYDISTYKSELEKLKEENTLLKEQLLKKSETEQSFQSLLDENKELKEYSKRMENQRENYYKEYNKYRSALEEIREIADKCKECLNEDDDCGCDYLRIVRKINEVLGEN